MAFRKLDPASPEAQERLALARQVLELKAASLTYAAIAARLAISKTHCWQLAQEALTEDRQILAERAADIRCLEAAKLDAWESSLADRLKSGDETAIAVALRIAHRRAQLLGLDAPQRTETRQVEEFEPREVVYARLQEKLESLIAKQQPPQQAQLALPSPEQRTAGPRGGEGAPPASAPAVSPTPIDRAMATDRIMGTLDAIRTGHIEPPIEAAEPPAEYDDDPNVIDAEVIGKPSFAGVPMKRADSVRTPSAIVPPHRSFFYARP